MIKMNLYFEDVHIDTCYAANIEEAYYMQKNLSDFWDMNECCIDDWFYVIKRPFPPQQINLFFDMNDQETKCWVILDKIADYYSYDYTTIDNTIILDSGIANTIGLKKIDKNDIINGHFEFSTIEEVLVLFLSNLKNTNNEDKKEGITPHWTNSVIEFIETLIPKRNNIEEKDVDELNNIIKKNGCSFKFKFKEFTNCKNVVDIVPASSLFIQSSVINIDDVCHDYVNYYFRKKGVEIIWNNTGTSFWANEN